MTDTGGSPGVVTTAPCPPDMKLPRELPAPVVGVTATDCLRYSYTVKYGLSGAANANTLAHAASRHPAGWLNLTVSPPVGAVTWNALPPSGVGGDTGFTVRTTVLANGQRARVTTPKNGYGTIKLEWLSGGAYFQLLSGRYATPDGPSGLGLSAMETVAASVR